MVFNCVNCGNFWGHCLLSGDNNIDDASLGLGDTCIYFELSSIKCVEFDEK